MKNFVGFPMNSIVQPVLVAVQTDHLPVDREMTRTHCRKRLKIGVVYPLVDCNMTAIDP